MAAKEVKLLKSGQKYLIGRKDRDLVVNHKKVSRDHGQIIVGGCTAEDVVRSRAAEWNSKAPHLTLYLGRPGQDSCTSDAQQQVQGHDNFEGR